MKTDPLLWRFIGSAFSLAVLFFTFSMDIIYFDIALVVLFFLWKKDLWALYERVRSRFKQ